MITLKVIFPEGKTIEIEKEAGVTPEDLMQEYKEYCVHPIYMCRFNNEELRINEPLMCDGVAHLLDITDPYANMAYQASLTILYLKAIHDVMGQDVNVTIANSLSKGVFTIIRKGNVTDELVMEIQNRMKELVDTNVMIIEEKKTKEEIINTLRDEKKNKVSEMVESANDFMEAYWLTIDDCSDISYTRSLPSTKYLNLFELRRYRNGVLLRFPHRLCQDSVPPYSEQRLLYEAFSEELHWEKLLGINFASDLNIKVRKDEYKDLVMLSEALHEKRIAQIAETIKEEGKRIILIAGPSSSGKTTFAKRLCIQLRVAGLNPLYLGTDDYFMDRADMIPDENGNLDFEALSAVDTELFDKQMNDLLAGKTVDLPEFNFIEGKKEFGKRIQSIDATQPIVIEGIHGLNPELSKDIADDAKFKIYISPLTQLNMDQHHRIPTTDARMLRRIVRDHRTRGRNAERTIVDWPSVRAGEEKYIFPFNGEADVFFNSQCIYELAVLKKYTQPLLEEITQESPAYPEAQRMLAFLRCFASIEDDSVIANNSILREFIGGSIVV